MIDVYTKEVKKELEKKAPDYTVREATVVKRNDNVRYGLSIDDNSGRPAPTFYLNEAFMADISPEQAADDIIEHFFSNMIEKPVDMKSSDMIDFSFEHIKDNLSLRLLDTEMNEMYMEEHPTYQIRDGFAYAFAYNLTDELSVVITKDMVERYDLKVEALYEKALLNEQEDVVLASLDPFGLSISDEENNYFRNGEEPEGCLFVLTNKEARFGANAMFYPGILKRIRDLLDEDFYIIPSSVHEVLIAKKSFADKPFADNAKNMRTMLKEGNRDLCSPEEVLAELPFYYSSEEGLTILDE